MTLAANIYSPLGSTTVTVEPSHICCEVGSTGVGLEEGTAGSRLKAQNLKDPSSPSDCNLLSLGWLARTWAGFVDIETTVLSLRSVRSDGDAGQCLMEHFR